MMLKNCISRKERLFFLLPRMVSVYRFLCSWSYMWVCPWGIMQVRGTGSSDFADASVGNQLNMDFPVLQLREWMCPLKIKTSHEQESKSTPCFWQRWELPVYYTISVSSILCSVLHLKVQHYRKLWKESQSLSTNDLTIRNLKSSFCRHICYQKKIKMCLRFLRVRRPFNFAEHVPVSSNNWKLKLEKATLKISCQNWHSV